MNNIDAQELAKVILKYNLTMVLATADGDSPWAATVVYVMDGQFNLYFMSGMDSDHVRHIKKNPKVAGVVLDQRFGDNSGSGVQIRGLAGLLEESEYPHITGMFFRAKYPANSAMPDYLQPEHILKSNRRLFKLTPSSFYVWDKEHWNTHREDRRVEVNFRS